MSSTENYYQPSVFTQERLNMFKFSIQHPLQNDKRIQQILVFSNNEVRNLFHEEMECRFNKAMDNYAGVDPEYQNSVRNNLSDIKAGILYKLRAIESSKGKWEAVIRCGVNDSMLYYSPVAHETDQLALNDCLNYLANEIHESISTNIQLLSTKKES